MTRTQHFAGWAVDPVRWPDIAVTPRSAVRAAIARALFGAEVARLPVRVVWVTGFFFEAVGDWQLARFRAGPAGRGRIMDRGLWRYTRHPNYFGDACMWWGIFGISYGSAVQLATVVSPLLMTVILTRGTGQRLTDRRLARTRPGYAEYAARTSGFIPLPPRPPRRGLPDGYRDRGQHARPARPRQPRAGAGVRRGPARRAGVRG